MKSFGNKSNTYFDFLQRMLESDTSFNLLIHDCSPDLSSFKESVLLHTEDGFPNEDLGIYEAYAWAAFEKIFINLDEGFKQELALAKVQIALKYRRTRLNQYLFPTVGKIKAQVIQLSIQNPLEIDEEKLSVFLERTNEIIGADFARRMLMISMRIGMVKSVDQGRAKMPRESVPISISTLNFAFEKVSERLNSLAGSFPFSSTAEIKSYLLILLQAIMDNAFDAFKKNLPAHVYPKALAKENVSREGEFKLALEIATKMADMIFGCAEMKGWEDAVDFFQNRPLTHRPIFILDKSKLYFILNNLRRHNLILREHVSYVAELVVDSFKYVDKDGKQESLDVRRVATEISRKNAPHKRQSIEDKTYFESLSSIQNA